MINNKPKYAQKEAAEVTKPRNSRLVLMRPEALSMKEKILRFE